MLAHRSPCTYHAEEAGHILIDEVPGVNGNFSGHEKLCAAGGMAYVQENVQEGKDRGIKDSFWDHFLDKERCDWRVEQFAKAFRDKYPDDPAIMNGPPC